MSEPKIKTLRIQIPDDVHSFTIPDHLNSVVIKNVGANPMKIYFDDDGEGNYWTLRPEKETPVLNVQGGQKFNTDGIDGSTTIEVMMW